MGFPAWLTGRNKTDTADKVVTMYDGPDAGTNLVGAMIFVDDGAGNAIPSTPSTAQSSEANVWNQASTTAVTAGDNLLGSVFQMPAYSHVEGHCVPSVAGYVVMRWSSDAGMGYYSQDYDCRKEMAAGVGGSFFFPWGGSNGQLVFVASGSGNIRGEARKFKPA